MDNDEMRRKIEAFVESAEGQAAMKRTCERIKASVEEARQQMRIPHDLLHRRVDI